MSGHREALQLSVVSCLTAILGEDQGARKSAEDEMKALEVTEEYGVILAEITVSQQSPVQYRQLASVILKQYVECHWSDMSNKYQQPTPPEQVKRSIRELLPAGLNDTQSKVRSTVAYAISAIAHWDWPEDWPDLFDHLILALSSGQPDLVHGVMRVLSEFCQDVSDTQMPYVAPVILPHLLKVIVQSDVYSVRTRCRAVHIFNTMASLICAMGETFPEAPKSLLIPLLPNYMSAFVSLLSSSDPSNDDPGLRKEIIMTLTQLALFLPRPLNPHIMEIVTPIWNILVSSTSIYVSGVVHSSNSSDEVCDSDGESIGQESTIFAIFEFISVIGESRKFQRLLPPILSELVYYLIAYMQITEAQVEDWLEDVNQFVEEDENELAYSVRLSAFELLQSLCEEPELSNGCHGAVMKAVERHLQEIPHHSSEHWWKIHEACMLGLDVLVDPLKSCDLQFNCQSFIHGVLLPDVINSSSPLLTGRCLLLASKMATLLKPDSITQLLELVAKALGTSQHPVLRVLATKTIYSFCVELKPTEHAQLMHPYLTVYLEHVISMAGDSPEDVLYIVIDTLQYLAQMDPKVTAHCAAKIVPVAMALFLKYSHDPGLMSCIEELFSVLARNPGCHGDLHPRFLPIAVEILSSNETQLPLGLAVAVLDLLVHIVRGCGSGGGEGATLVSQIFPCVVQRVLSSDDTAMLQNGGECVRAFVSTMVEELATWRDSTDHNGLQYVIQVVLHLLDPARAEYSAAFVGKLIIAFVKKVGSALGEHLELLLRAVLSKMQRVETSSVMQSLLVVFAHLIQTDLESVVSFLSQVPDPTGKPALNFVMSEWCTKHPFFYGVYETRVSSLALCKILTHCIQTGDDRLTEVKVRGEEINTGQDGIQTRSRRAIAPSQWTEVSLPMKIVKLLVSDVQNGLEIQGKGQHNQDSEDDEEDEFGSEAIESTLESLLASARDYSTSYDDNMAEWEMEDDPDLIDEPVLQMDMQDHLQRYLLELSQQPCFGSFYPLLTHTEQLTLTTIGIAVT